MKYPENFTRDELIYSKTAAKYGINNEPISHQHEQNLVMLACWLQSLRNALSAFYGRDVAISVRSGYRSRALNNKIKGSKTSYHMLGLAADIRASGLTTVELARFIEMHFLQFDQVIEEYGIWVHVGLPKPRRQVMEKKRGKRYKLVSFV